MKRTLQVLLVIATISSAVQVCALAVELLEPIDPKMSPYVERAVATAALRWKVYWFSGVGVGIVAYAVSKRYTLTGYALGISGVYLMLLGNNSGLWAQGYVVPRIITSGLTFCLLLARTMREQRLPDA